MAYRDRYGNVKNSVAALHDAFCDSVELEAEEGLVCKGCPLNTNPAETGVTCSDFMEKFPQQTLALMGAEEIDDYEEDEDKPKMEYRVQIVNDGAWETVICNATQENMEAVIGALMNEFKAFASLGKIVRVQKRQISDWVTVEVEELA